MEQASSGVDKVQRDGALFDNSVAINAVFRDERGTFVGGFVKMNLHFSKPEIVEAFGIQEALSWLHERKRECVQVESDCLRVIQAINSPIFDTSYFGLLISDCKAILASLMNV